MRGFALKVTYNDGGSEGGRFGFRGTCSNQAMVTNILERKATNCASPGGACRTFLEGGFVGRRPSEPLCYEAYLLRSKPWRFGCGYYHHGPKANTAIPIVGIEPGNIAFLTTVLPEDASSDRIVFGAYRVGRFHLVDGEGHTVESDGTMEILLPADVARELRFFDYYSNDDGRKVWGSGLVRYLAPQKADELMSRMIRLLGDCDERNHLLHALGPSYQPDVVALRRGGGEGEDHRRLKLHVAANPQVIGLPPTAKAYVEHPFESGDQVDILFTLPDGRHVVVEIETDMPYPGAHQCIKYRALQEAATSRPLASGAVDAVLVAHDFTQRERVFAERYGIRLCPIRLE